MLRVLIADDHVIVRAGLRRVVESFPGIEVVAEADDGDEVPALIDEHRPDVVITDLSMKRHSGFDVLRTLGEKYPEVGVIIVSMHADAAHISRALAAGASGYVLKDAAPAELEQALRAVAAGKAFFGQRVAAARAAAAATPKLSPRQAEILQMLGQGLGTKEIAARLGVGPKTIETHRARLMQALNLRGASELLRYAVLQNAKTTD